MTLFKQLALVISLIIITILGAVMYINYNSAKKSMVESLYETTVNNIGTLTENLAVASDEKALLITTIDVAFDSGYYKSIEYKSNNSAFHYKQVDIDPIEGVPLWFVNNTTIELEQITEDVSLGWEIVGEVIVKGDTGVVYKALYKMFVNLLYLFVITVSISLLILSILLHYVLKPLKSIQKQAEAILQNKFILQDKVPYTKEFKDVVKGMNSMVKRVEDIFDEANESARRNRELLYNDPVTKLFNRRYLMLKLLEVIELENRVDGGVSMFISLNSIETLNSCVGRQQSMEFMITLSQVFEDVTDRYEERLVARVNELDFAMILPSCEDESAIEIVKEIKRSFTLLLQKYEIDESLIYINIGMFRYKSNASVADLLTKTDSSLIKAKADEESYYYFYKEADSKNALGKDQWRSIIEEAIEKDSFRLKFYSAVNTNTQVINHKVMTFIIQTDDNKQYYFGDFIAPAINLGLVSKIFLVSIKKLLTQKDSSLKGQTISIRLSNEFMRDLNSLSELSEIIETYAKKLEFNLMFEISNSFTIQHTQLVKSFVEIFQHNNIGFGINAFTGESSDYTYLKELNPVFLKADARYLLDQSIESMNTLHVLTNSLDIEIVATFVSSKEEMEKLQKEKVLVIQGPVTDSL